LRINRQDAKNARKKTWRMPQEIMKSRRFVTLLAFLASWRLILKEGRIAAGFGAGGGGYGDQLDVRDDAAWR